MIVNNIVNYSTLVHFVYARPDNRIRRLYI